MAAWNWLINSKKVEPNSIVIFGRSLGSSIAAELATHVQPAGLWIESGFTSVRDVGALYCPRWLVNVICQYKYPTLEYVKKVKCPILVVHSPDDQVCPYKFGQAVFAAANEPKTMVTIQGQHNNGFIVSGDLYSKPVKKWLNAI
jgi:fermentation-respiration switch protein FrsA (DUF1100 family)